MVIIWHYQQLLDVNILQRTIFSSYDYSIYDPIINPLIYFPSDQQPQRTHRIHQNLITCPAINTTNTPLQPTVYLYCGLIIQLAFVIPVELWWVAGIEPLLLYLGQTRTNNNHRHKCTYVEFISFDDGKRINSFLEKRICSSNPPSI